MATIDSYWVHDLSPFLIEFPNNPLGLDGIRYYGLSYLLGFIAAWWLLRVYNQRGKFAIDADARASLMTAIILGVLGGGRLGYMLLYDLEAFLSDPLLILRVQDGGMASHGGFVGVLIAIIWFAWKQKIRVLALSDVLVTVGPLGLFFGRVANFINGELWGKVTTVSWAVIFPGSPEKYTAAVGAFVPEPRHPSQLYEATLEGLLPFLYLQWRYWKTKPTIGQLSGEFLISYGVTRIICEIFREPDADLILGLSRGQFYSIFMILAGAAIIAIVQRKKA
ncbi:MAG TPA: prolipoprotein diacylglyceryl transferase [Opitutae bacterium]|nr:prolipoprotein diacylglyceryl transferase [Opitutae bacterium]